MAGEDPKPKPIRRYFTKEDFENGLCDANGVAIPGGQKEPPRITIANRVRGKRVTPEVAARAAEDPSSMSRSGSLQPASKTAVDPLKIDNVKQAETGIHDKVPVNTDDPSAADLLKTAQENPGQPANPPAQA